MAEPYRYCLVKYLLHNFLATGTTDSDYGMDAYNYGLVAAEGSSGGNVKCVAGLQIPPPFVQGSDIHIAMDASSLVTEFNDKLKDEGFAAAKTVYTTKTIDGTTTTLQTLAKASYTGSALYDQAVAHFGSATWLDDYMLSALDATGEFAGTLGAAHGLMTEARTEAAKKAAQDQILVMAALATLQSGTTNAARWRAMWMYWSGIDRGSAPWARANKRCKNYGTCGGMTKGANGQLANVRSHPPTCTCSCEVPLERAPDRACTARVCAGQLQPAACHDPRHASHQQR